MREQVSRGELADYEAKLTAVRTSGQSAAAMVARLLAVARQPGTAEHEELLAEGIAHARAALANPTARAIVADGRADPDIIRLALAVLQVVVAARDGQEHGGTAQLADDGLLADADQLLQVAAESARQLGNAVPSADQAALLDLAARRAALAARR